MKANAMPLENATQARPGRHQPIAFVLWLAVPIVGQFSPLAAVAVGLVGFGFYVAAVARE